MMEPMNAEKLVEEVNLWFLSMPTGAYRLLCEAIKGAGGAITISPDIARRLRFSDLPKLSVIANNGNIIIRHSAE